MTQSGDATEFANVDAAMQSWRQGDIAQVHQFHHLADLREPVTSESATKSGSFAHTGQSTLGIDTSVDGLVVLTQTCDIRRSASTRPYVEVCPLVHVDEATAKAASAREMPRYAAIPAVGAATVADLDRVMTVEKGWLSFASRIPGWTTDAEIRRFQAAVARRYQRFAFPDDFTKSMSKLRTKIIDRHGKQTSPEGKLFAEVKEIRVTARPGWSADNIETTLTFILPSGTLDTVPEELVSEPRLGETLQWLSARERNSADISKRVLSEPDISSRSILWQRLGEAWAKSCKPTGCITAVYGEVVDALEYPIAEYWASDQLDLDYLSDDSSAVVDVADIQVAAPSGQVTVLRRIRRFLRL